MDAAYKNFLKMGYRRTGEGFCKFTLRCKNSGTSACLFCYYNTAAKTRDLFIAAQHEVIMTAEEKKQIKS